MKNLVTDTADPGAFATFPGLPKICASRNNIDESPILIRRGHLGFWNAAGLNVEEFNIDHAITPAQQEAMLMGSMFGWHVPGADPATYDSKGHFIKEPLPGKAKGPGMVFGEEENSPAHVADVRRFEEDH